MTNRVLCGVHTLQDKSDSKRYYPVAVYFKVSDDLTSRETGLEADDQQETLEHALDYLDDAISYSHHGSIVGQEYTEEELTAASMKLDTLEVHYPSRELLGNKTSGLVVGWHIDVKTNARRRGKPPYLIANIAWMRDGKVNYVIVGKEPLLLGGNTTGRDITAAIDRAFVALSISYPLGGSLKLEVVPSGKRSARYSVSEYTRPLNTLEVICQTLKEATR